MYLNNKGFTLIEILAAIIILSVVSGIAVIGVMSSINKGKDASYNIMINNIIVASNTLYEEISNSYLIGNDRFLYKYDSNGKTSDKIVITDGKININLQTLVSNGFLDGSNNDSYDDNVNKKVLINPKTGLDIGSCLIEITSLGVNSLGGDNCPDSYSKGVK